MPINISQEKYASIFMAEELLLMELYIPHISSFSGTGTTFPSALQQKQQRYLIYTWLRKTGAIPPLPNLSMWCGA
jgi:hypothetical protein